MVFLDAEGSNLSFKVHCFGDKRDYRQYENFQIMTRLGRYPILDVIDDVTTWRPGELFTFSGQLSFGSIRHILNFVRIDPEMTDDFFYAVAITTTENDSNQAEEI